MVRMNSETLDVALVASYRRFDEEEKRRAALDTKAALVLSFLPLTVAVLTNLVPALLAHQTSIGTAAFVLVAVAAVAMLLGATIAIFAFGVRKFLAGPGALYLRAITAEVSSPDLQQILLESYCSAVQNNQSQNDRKSLLLVFSFTSILCGSALLVLVLIIL